MTDIIFAFLNLKTTLSKQEANIDESCTCPDRLGLSVCGMRETGVWYRWRNYSSERTKPLLKFKCNDKAKRGSLTLFNHNWSMSSLMEIGTVSSLG